MEWLEELIAMIIVSAAFILFLLLLSFVPQKKYHFEYIDVDNNKGTAKECSYKFKEGRAGGQGSPVCVLEDGTVKQVKEYKAVYVGTYRVIDELRGNVK